MCMSTSVRTCLSVCLSVRRVREYISVTTRQIFTKFYECYLWSWLGPYRLSTSGL